MAQILLWLYSLLHHEQVSVHFVHIADWEDQAHIATFGDAPAKWTVYCVQFPRPRTFHLDTAAWNCHTRVDIPWQQLPHRRPDGSVGMALVLPALRDCRWWLESLLVHSGVSSATPPKGNGRRPQKKWQQLPHPVVFTAAPIPFHCTNPNCIWFAVPYGPKGQYLICHRFIGTFLYNQCIVCFLSWVVEQASCNIHTAAGS